METVDRYNSEELRSIISDRLKSNVVNTYKIFEDAPVLGLFGRYKPTDEVKEKTIKYFQKQLADSANSKNIDSFYQEARDIVDTILEDGYKKAKYKVKGLPDIAYVKKTLEKVKDEKFAEKIVDSTGLPSKYLLETRI